MTDTRIKIALSEETLSAIDSRRGDIPRQRYLQRIIEERVAVDRGGVLVPEPSKAPPEKPARQVIEEAMQVPSTRPIDIMKERPSKPPPQRAVQVPIARQTEEGAPKVVDTLTVNVQQERCDHPKGRRQTFGWGTLCDACGKRI